MGVCPEPPALFRRVDHTRAGDLITGTWARRYPTPLTLAADPEPAPDYAVTGHAFRLTFTDGTTRVYYGETLLTIG